MPEDKKFRIKHVWFDFSDTLASLSEGHDKLLYETYAKAVGKPVSAALIKEYEELYKKYGSNSAVFTNGLGLVSGYWAKCVDAIELGSMYKLADSRIPIALDQLRKIVPISIFSNMKMDKLLPSIGLDRQLFTHLLSGADFPNPKPALDGFKKVIEMSNLPPQNILFIGDSVQKEIMPAKKVGMIAGLVWSASPEADFSFKNFEEILNTVKQNQ